MLLAVLIALSTVTFALALASLLILVFVYDLYPQERLGLIFISVLFSALFWFLVTQVSESVTC